MSMLVFLVSYFMLHSHFDTFQGTPVRPWKWTTNMSIWLFLPFPHDPMTLHGDLPIFYEGLNLYISDRTFISIKHVLHHSHQ